MALIDCSTHKRLTYSQALIATILLSKRFRKYQDEFVGVMLPNSAGAILSLNAILMSGKIPVMINYAAGVEKNISYAQKKCSFQTVITSRKLVEKLECKILPGMVFLEDLFQTVTTKEKVRAATISKLPLPLLLKKYKNAQEDDDALLLFTSGSERMPKAVELTHRNIYSNVKSADTAFEIKNTDRFLSVLPYFHVFGQTVTGWLPILRGLPIITYGNPLEYKTVVEFICKEKATVVCGTPAFLRGYLKVAEKKDLESVRLAIVGGDKAPEWMIEKFQADHKIPLYEGYGTTETSPVISANSPSNNRPGSVGKPFPGVEVKIISIESEKELSTNEVGKIMVKGDLVMKGYYDDIEETSLHIKNGWYETGDMGRIDEDGYLWHRGRLKRFVKIGGEMVSLVMIEYLLEKITPEDISCCVVELPDPRKGAQIIIVLTDRVDEKSILKQLAAELPRIAVPKKFVYVDELPKLPSCKIDFRKTTEMVKEMMRQGVNSLVKAKLLP